jgi:hypothetical protein
MAYLTILSGYLAVTEKPRLLVCDLSRAVAREMKTRATVRAKEIKPNSTHRGIFWTGRAMGRTAGSAGQPKMWRHLLDIKRISLHLQLGSVRNIWKDRIAVKSMQSCRHWGLPPLKPHIYMLKIFSTCNFFIMCRINFNARLSEECRIIFKKSVEIAIAKKKGKFIIFTV